MKSIAVCKSENNIHARLMYLTVPSIKHAILQVLQDIGRSDTVCLPLAILTLFMRQRTNSCLSHSHPLFNIKGQTATFIYELDSRIHEAD